MCICVYVCVCVSSQVARTMAPSVIYMDEAEKIFLSDKKKLKEFGSQVGLSYVTHVC